MANYYTMGPHSRHGRDVRGQDHSDTWAAGLKKAGSTFVEWISKIGKGNAARCAHCHKSGALIKMSAFCSHECYTEAFQNYQRELANKKCRLQGCQKQCYTENDGMVYDFCSRSHAQQFQKQMQWEHNQKQQQQRYPRGKLCKYPECTKSCYSKHSQTHDFCSRSHAEMYKLCYMQINESAYCGQQQRGNVLYYQPQWANDTGPIYFYNKDEPYYDFTNFAAHCVTIDDKVWPTTEHYFQAQKFVGTPYEDVIRKLSFPREAFDFSRKPEVSYWRRCDWEEVKDDVMYKALLAKFTQHEFLNNLLLGTKDRPLVEHTRNDSYWGDGGDGTGKNRLGSLLMKVRERLRMPTMISPLPSPQYTATTIEMMQSKSPEYSDRSHDCHDLMDMDDSVNSPLTSPKAPPSEGPLMNSNDIATDKLLSMQDQAIQNYGASVPSTAAAAAVQMNSSETPPMNSYGPSSQLVGTPNVSTSAVATHMYSQIVSGTSTGVAMNRPGLVGTAASSQAASTSTHESTASSMGISTDPSMET